MNSEFGIAVGLQPTRRTVACGRLMATSVRCGLIRLSSRRRVRNSEFVSDQLQPSEGAVGNSEFKIQNSKFGKALCA